MANSNLKNGFLESELSKKPFGIEIGFVSNNVESTFEKSVKAGATITEESKQKPWGQTVAYIQDIDGFLIKICSLMNM